MRHVQRNSGSGKFVRIQATLNMEGRHQLKGNVTFM
jgi:hypothetical protein